MLCPDCRLPLDSARLACANGHVFGYDENGVLVLLAADFAWRLAAFTAAFSAIRAAEGRRLLDASIYPQLPFAPEVRRDHEWRLRGYDLGVVTRLLDSRKGLRILDVGAWNGWLSHRLAMLGHHVIAIDYFSDPYDGLGARKWYGSNWIAIQMNLNDLSILDDPLNSALRAPLRAGAFDLVILNRCLQFQPDPVGFVASASRLLAPGGLLLALGMQVFADPAQKVREVADLLAFYRQTYDFDLFLWPTKGYLDRADLALLTTAGMIIHPYRPLFLANLKARLKPALPWHGFGSMQASIPNSTPA